MSPFYPSPLISWSPFPSIHRSFYSPLILRRLFPLPTDLIAIFLLPTDLKDPILPLLTDLMEPTPLFRLPTDLMEHVCPSPLISVDHRNLVVILGRSIFDRLTAFWSRRVTSDLRLALRMLFFKDEIFFLLDFSIVSISSFQTIRFKTCLSFNFRLSRSPINSCFTIYNIIMPNSTGTRINIQSI